MEAINTANLKSVMEGRCAYYEQQSEALRSLIEAEGVDIENYGRRRQSLLQGLAADIGKDLSVIARAKIQCAGSPYYSNMLGDFCFYLKDYLSSLRLFAGAEKGSFVG